MPNRKIAFTSDGNPRGQVSIVRFRELWVHCGTDCNLNCNLCYESSRPGDSRLEAMALDAFTPYMNEAKALGVELFGFTGGEPFVNPEFVLMLDAALDVADCLVLTNGTRPMRRAIDRLLPLRAKANRLTVRVSLDSPLGEEHDANRGAGRFEEALAGLRLLHGHGFPVAVARMARRDEDAAMIASLFRRLFRKNGLPEALPVVSLPPLQVARDEVPEITEECMSRYHTPRSVAGFMCSYLRMLVKRDATVELAACTLVDDDVKMSIAASLADSLDGPVYLAHPRCHVCFTSGVSCSGE